MKSLEVLSFKSTYSRVTQSCCGGSNNGAAAQGCQVLFSEPHNPCCKTTKNPKAKGCEGPPRLSSHHNQKEQGVPVTNANGRLDDLNYC